MSASERNLETVRAGFEAFERGDMEAMMAHFSEDLVTHRVPPQPVGTWSGREGFLKAMADWTEDFGEWSLDFGELAAPNDSHVLAQTIQRAVGAASGVPIEGKYWMLFRFTGEQVTRIEFHSTEASALEAAQRGG